MALKPDRSAFLDLLDWLDRPGQAVLNLARGNPGAAGRHALDFLGGPIDLLPGNVVPDQAQPEDYAHGGDLLGIDRAKNPFMASAADSIVGGLANPLTYLGFGKGRGVTAFGKTIALEGRTVDPLTLAGNAASAGIDALPTGLRTAALRGTQRVKNTLGWLNPTEGIDDISVRGDAISDRVARSKELAVQAMFKGTDPEDRKRAFRLIQNYERNPTTGQAYELGPSGAGVMGTVADQEALLQARAAKAPWSPEEKLRAIDLARKSLLHERVNFQEGIQDYPIMQGVFGEGQSIDTHAPLDYAQRSFALEDSPNALKGRKLAEPGQLVKHLNENADIPLEEDLAIASAGRSAQQARMAKRGYVGQQLIERGLAGELGENVQGAVMQTLDKRQRAGSPLAGDAFSTLSDERSRATIDDVIAELERISPDDARVLKTSWAGLEEPGLAVRGLNAFNRLFKPAAVFGLGFPGKPATVMRNAIAFPTQLAAEESIPTGQALKQLARTPQTAAFAFRQGANHSFNLHLPGGEMGEVADTINRAFEQSGGRASKAVEALRSSGRDDLAQALENGVFDNGFVNAESMTTPIRDTRWLSKGMQKAGIGPVGQERAWRFLEGGQESFQGAEEYGRGKNYLDLRQRLIDQGVAPEEAARQAAGSVRRGLYDYRTQSEEQRGLAAAIPFAKFTTNAIRQNAKWLSRTPAVGTFAAGLYGDEGDDPIYPYLQEQAHVRVGNDEQGNPQYLAGLGLPLEALNQIPNPFGATSVRSVGRDLERTIGGSAQPVLKTAYGAFSGHDPYFGTPFNSYDKLPVYGHAGAAGRAYNLVAGTGLIQPLDTPLGIANKITDDRRSVADKAIDLLSGAKFVSVDPDLALQQELTQTLENNPNIRQTRDLYAVGGDDETAALLHELRRVKAKQKKERQALRAGVNVGG